MLRQTRNQFSAKSCLNYKQNVICCAELTAQLNDNNYAVLPKAAGAAVPFRIFRGHDH